MSDLQTLRMHLEHIELPIRGSTSIRVEWLWFEFGNYQIEPGHAIRVNSRLQTALNFSIGCFEWGLSFHTPRATSHHHHLKSPHVQVDHVDIRKLHVDESLRVRLLTLCLDDAIDDIFLVFTRHGICKVMKCDMLV